MNKSAPINTVGIYDDGSVCGNTLADGETPYVGWEDWATCAPAPDASGFHWARNTQFLANNITHNPYASVGRNTIRGWAWNNYDVALQKTTKLSERVTMTLSLIDYNASNRQYLGTPDTFIDDVGGSLMDYRYNYGSNRNTQLKAQFQF